MPHHVLVGVTGGIAAYKICEIVSALGKQPEFEVKVILTEAATAFVSPLTFATLSRQPAFTDGDFWQPTHGKPLHIALGEWADVFLIAPLTANTLGKLTYGLADNLLTNTVLASRCPILLAPAMNTSMWEQLSVRQNWLKLQTDPRIFTVAPQSGILACDAVGTGRMAEPQAILDYLESLLWTKGKRDLTGKQVLVSAGGTREFLDPVRFIGNPATGKQGLAIATAAQHRGANVTLVSAGTETSARHVKNDDYTTSISSSPSTPFHQKEQSFHNTDISLFNIINVNTSAKMHKVMLQEFARADLTIMAAAVGDVRPANYSDRKIPKAELPNSLPLQKIRDILMDLSVCKRPNQILVGFAAQTGTPEEIQALALAKLKDKGLDAIAANAIDSKNTGFATSTNQATFLNKQGDIAITPICSKLELAHRLFDFLASGSSSLLQ